MTDANRDRFPDLDEIETELGRLSHRSRYRRALRSTVGTLVVVAAMAVLIATLFLPVMRVTGTSMEPNLCAGDIIVGVKTNNYVIGQVCSFYFNNKLVLKRVIGTAGDWIDIDENGRVYVNNVPLDEPYVQEYAKGICDIELPYDTTYDGTTINNRLIPRPPQEYTDIHGTKTWVDDDNESGTRPSYITVRLLRDGVEIDRRIVSAATGWAYSFEHLPCDDGYGNVYTYTVTEDPVPGYFSQQDGYDFTNTKVPGREPDKPDEPDEPERPPETPPERHTGTKPPPFKGQVEEELEELLELPMYGTPLAGMLRTGDETPLYPYIFGSAGALAVIALFLLGRKRRKENG